MDKPEEIQGDSSHRKEEMALREQQLKLEELELKVKELKRPDYKRLNFWTSGIAVLIALGGVIGQNYLSTIKSESAKLETERAKEEIKSAMQKKDSLSNLITQNIHGLDSMNNKLRISQQDYSDIERQKDSAQTLLAQITSMLANKPNTPSINEIKVLAAKAQKELAPLPPRVYIQIGDESQRQLAETFQSALKAKGFLAPGIEDVGKKGLFVPKNTEVRYVRSEDKQEALVIVTILNTLGIEANDKFLQTGNDNKGTRPRHYEVWFSKP